MVISKSGGFLRKTSKIVQKLVKMYIYSFYIRFSNIVHKMKKSVEIYKRNFDDFCKKNKKVKKCHFMYSKLYGENVFFHYIFLKKSSRYLRVEINVFSKYAYGWVCKKMEKILSFCNFY